MRFISSKTHGILDYLSGILLILSPWLFGFANGGMAQNVPVITGILILVMALFTNYELGAVKVLPFNFHLAIDIMAGAFLALSPWMFGFADEVFVPHLIFGIFEMTAGLFTRNVPFYKRI
jgi:hypothetical protein